jgi:hypothetical protein
MEQSKPHCILGGGVWLEFSKSLDISKNIIYHSYQISNTWYTYIKSVKDSHLIMSVK